MLELWNRIRGAGLIIKMKVRDSHGMEIAVKIRINFKVGLEKKVAANGFNNKMIKV